MATYANWIQRDRRWDVILAEVEVSRRLYNWTLHSGAAYKVTFPASGETFVATGVFEDNTALTSVGDIATVISTAGSWYHDTSAALLYVRASDDANPDTHVTRAQYKWYFSDGIRSDGKGIIFNSNYYEPLIADSFEFRDVRRIEDPFHFTQFVNQIKLPLLNGEHKKDGVGIFDKYSYTEQWREGTITLLHGDGGVELAYGEHQNFGAYEIDNVDFIDESLFVLAASSRRFLTLLPPRVFTLADYPKASSGIIGKGIPVLYGDIFNVPAYAIDVSAMKYKICDHALDAIYIVKAGIDGAITTTNDLPNGEYTRTTTTVQNFSLTANTADGSVGAATYYATVTAVDAGGGETVAATEASAVLGATGRLFYRWDRYPGAASYRLYRGTATGTYTLYYSVGRETLEYTWTDDTKAESGSPPTTNTFVDRSLDIECGRKKYTSGDPYAFEHAGSASKDLLETWLGTTTNAASFTAVDNALHWRVQIYLSEKRQEAWKVLRRIEQSTFTHFSLNTSGEVTMTKLDPKQTADHTLAEADIYAMSVDRPNIIPITRVRCNYFFNYQTEGVGSVESSQPTGPENQYTETSREDIIVYLQDRGPAETLANMYAFIGSQIPIRVTLVGTGRWLQIMEGDVVSLTVTRGFGGSDGTFTNDLLLVREVIRDPLNNEVTMICDDWFGVGRLIAWVQDDGDADWSAATEHERFYLGHITDSNGLADTADYASAGYNRIWR